jgi:hypothetical protein
VVSPHEERAYVEFAQTAPPAAAIMYELAPEYPMIEVIPAGTRVDGPWERSVHRLQSVDDDANVAFRLACADLAERVHQRLLS